MKTITVKYYLETTVKLSIPDKPKNAIETEEEWGVSMIGAKGEELAFMLDGRATVDRWTVDEE